MGSGCNLVRVRCYKVKYLSLGMSLQKPICIPFGDDRPCEGDEWQSSTIRGWESRRYTKVS